MREADFRSLTPELEEFVSNSGGHGFIIVSFGSNVAVLRQSVVDMLATAFGKLKQRVVWRLKGNNFLAYFPGGYSSVHSGQTHDAYSVPAIILQRINTDKCRKFHFNRKTERRFSKLKLTLTICSK